MKETYRMKEPLASHIDTLYGKSVSKIITENFLKAEVPVYHHQLYRLKSPVLDNLGFVETDFETVVEYDKEGWNTFPDCKPTEDEEGEYFICRSLGCYLVTHTPYKPVLCRFADGKFWDEDAGLSPSDYEASFCDAVEKPFIFKKINFPKE